MQINFFPIQKSILKSLEVKPEVVDLILIDGQKRRLTPSVFLLMTHAEIQGNTETRYFALHSKRGYVSNALINWLKSYLRKKGWVFCWVFRGLVSEPTRGTWEGVFQK